MEEIIVAIGVDGSDFTIPILQLSTYCLCTLIPCQIHINDPLLVLSTYSEPNLCKIK